MKYKVYNPSPHCSGQCSTNYSPSLSAAAGPTEEAGGVTLVDEDERLVLVGQPADLGQRADVPVHREHAVRHNQPRAVILPQSSGVQGVLVTHLRVRQPPLQVRHVLVLVAQLFGLAQPDAVNDGGVVELV